MTPVYFKIIISLSVMRKG